MPQRATRAAFNNAIASGDQQAALRSNAGRGLSRGRGQSFLDTMRSGAAKAQAENSAFGILAADTFANANYRSQFNQANRQDDLERRRMLEQQRSGEWDSRFGNLTSIWGALSGLLR